MPETSNRLEAWSFCEVGDVTAGAGKELRKVCFPPTL